MFEFKLPDLGEGIHEGEVLKWFAKVGETIIEDDPLIEVETDKAAVTIPSPRGGVITSQKGGLGDTLYVGDVIVVIDDGTGEAVVSSEPATEAVSSSSKPVSAISPSAQMPETLAKESGRPVPAAPATRRLARELGVNINLIKGTGPAGRVTPDDVKLVASGERLATPVAPATRRLARELGVNINQIKGSGPAGRVTFDDVKLVASGEKPAASAQPASAKGVSDSCAVAEFAAHASSTIPFLDIEQLPDYSKEGPIETEKLRSIRRKVARKMITTKVLVPHVVHMDEADVTELDKLRREENARRDGKGNKLTLLPFVIKSVIAGLKEFPAFNASLDPFKEEIIYKKYYNMGIAVDSDRGLIVPVIKNADQKNVNQLTDKLHELADEVRNKTVNVSELHGGTFTITNIGPIGGTGFFAAINYPEVAILGLGRAQDKPVVRNGEIVIRKILPLSLSFDHRITDGADAARLVSGVVKRLSNPNTMLLEI